MYGPGNGWQLISNGNFGQNVEFFYSNGTVIPSWLESYSGSSAIWWLKLGSIPASSSITVYMGIAPTSTNLFNTVNDGEAPQLTCPNPSDTASCSTYAEYDDGANVFNYYTNFAGTSLPSGWSVTQGGGSPFNYTIENGLLLQTGSSGSAVIQYTTRPFNFQTNVLEALGAMETNGCMEFGAGLLDNDGPCGGPNSTGIGTDTNDLYYWIRPDGDDEVGFPNPIHVGTTLYVMSQWESTTQLYGEINYGDLDTTSSTFVPDTSLYISVNIAERTVLNSKMYLQWVRVRAYPPNGVMPSVSFGSVA